MYIICIRYAFKRTYYCSMYIILYIIVINIFTDICVNEK